ncbi:thiamine pyrophosphate-binding protein [Paludifilum halophilum]|nr:thiamine pyrophosphate-binding protein [Paludifilum halophilum]
MIRQRSDPRNVAQHLIQQLLRWGCERIYGVIGDGNLYLLDELGNQDQIKYIACRHETDAALMAAAEAKLTGKLAVCTATSGPGIALLLNGLADAWQDRAPVLAVTGQVQRTHIGTGSVQDIDQQLLMQPLAYYSTLVPESQSFPQLLNIAVKTALERGGVAHLSIPKEVWRLPVSEAFYPLPPTPPVPAPPPEDVNRVAARIDQAQRPIILAGRGIKPTGAEALQLAEKIRAPIMVTMPAKSSVPNDHPLFVGGLGQAGTEPSRELLHQADLCIILGATWWPKDYVPPSIPIIQIDAVSENIGRSHPATDWLVGDMSAVLPQLVASVQPKTHPSYFDEIQEKKASWNARIRSEIEDQTEPLSPARAIAELNRWIDPDAIMAVDVGDHTLWLERIFQFRNQELLISGTWRTLGFSLPAGIAAQLANPNRQVVSIAGDGGVAHSIIDLVTAVTYRLPLTLIILNNEAYFMETGRMIVEGLNTLGSRVPNPDYAALARACGAEGYRVEQPEELQTALPQALASDQTSVVDIHCTGPIFPHTKILKG